MDYHDYNIFENPTLGRYATATKNLEPGDLIISELPFTYGPKSDSQPVCLGCLVGVNGKTVCSTCGWPVCSTVCEKLPIHAMNECLVFADANIRFIPVQDPNLSCPQFECITPLRVLLTKEREADKWESEIKILESHIEERRKTEIWEVEKVNVVQFLRKRCKLENRFSEDLIHFACGILEINAFAAPAGSGYEMRCLYPKTSFLTHSCVPNVGHFIFGKSDNNENFRIFVRAMVKIEKGQELLLSYTQSLSPTLFRRAHLKEGKFFNCSCRRCADPTELRTNMSTIKCSKCPTGWLLSVHSLDENSPWKCTCCEFLTTGESIMKLFRIIEQEMDELDDLKSSDPIGLREAFLKKYSSTVHPHHALMLNVKSSLTQLYGRAEGYQLEDLPDILLERKIQLCNLINKISEIIKPGLSRQRGWNFYELYSPLVMLAKKQFARKIINEKQLKNQLAEACQYLEIVCLIFSYEDPSSVEGIIGKIAFQSLKDLQNSIDAL